MKKILLTELYIPANSIESNLIFVINNNLLINATIKFNIELKDEEIKYWFSNLSYDQEKNILSDYFNFITSVENLYTTRITFVGK